jgi:molybdopterin-guanine dinucleotide biosynthesis protein
MSQRPIVIAVSGLSSNTGKTTLACELIERLPGWEAIKITRGHYRSCGKDPSGCCVSDLLRDEPLIRSGREANYEKGKDTGRFWYAGAANVHWVIVGEDQVERGINEALARVRSAGVIVEGNSFLDYIEADFAITCARAGENKLKTSARRTLARADALYLSTIDGSDRAEAIERFEKWQKGLSVELNAGCIPVYARTDLLRLVDSLRERVTVRSSQMKLGEEPSKMATESSSGREPGDRQPILLRAREAGDRSQ